MIPIPWLLEGSQHAEWLRSAPPVVIDDRGDAFRKSVNDWLNDQPGHNSQLSPEEQDAMRSWLHQYGQLLIIEMIEEPSLGDDRLLVAFLSMIAGTVGAVALNAYAATLFLPTGIIVAAGVGVMAISFALASMWKNAWKGRRLRILKGIHRRLISISFN